MKLLTKKILNQLKPLYTYENSPPEIVPIAVKFFNPCGSGTWYITEWDGEDIMFGLCCIHMAELGYVSFKELSSLKLPMGLSIERDMYWKGTLLDAMKKEGYSF